MNVTASSYNAPYTMRFAGHANFSADFFSRLANVPLTSEYMGYSRKFASKIFGVERNFLNLFKIKRI